MLPIQYELIRPTLEAIEQFNAFWDECNQSVNWNISIFKEMPSINIKNYISEQELHGFGNKDKEIREAVDAKNIDAFFSAINAVYHTRLNTTEIALDLDWETLELMDIHLFIDHCERKTGKKAYSFASKVFSFLHPDTCPIIDSISVTLLEKYLGDTKKHTKKNWGDYAKYVEAYKAFIRKYELDTNENISYKQIDIFLWTYGILLQRYWLHCGVLKFEGVSYTKPKEIA